MYACSEEKNCTLSQTYCVTNMQLMIQIWLYI